VDGTEWDVRDRWARWGAWSACVGMVSWVVGVALIPLDAKVENGDRALMGTLASMSTRLYVAAMLAVVGGALLVTFFAVLTRLVPEGEQGWGLLRVSLAGCVLTQTMVAVGASIGLAGFHAAGAGAEPGIVAFAWRALWLTFTASAVPTIVFTVTGVLGMTEAGLAAGWVAALGWLSAGAHVIAMLALAQSGPLAPDGIVGSLAPLTTVVWVLAAAAGLRKRVGVQADLSRRRRPARSAEVSPSTG
jgi:hypothetical protein